MSLGLTTPPCTDSTTEPPQTVGQKLDMQIAETRKHLEQLCVTKAKAEALQMLDYPMNFIRKIVW